MHLSGSAKNKAQQRTSTSCTECRRRKQRCNQAKDRPCNNCIRRYPAVECLYEGTTSPASLDQIRGETICSQSQDDQQQISPLSNLTGDHSHSHATHSGYAQPTNTHQNFVSTTSTDGYFPVIYYHSQNIEMTIATLPGPSYVTTTSAGDDYLMDDGSAYYVCIDSGYGGPYYEKLGQVNQRYWVTGQSDMSSFSGTGNSGLKGCWVTATIQSDGGDFVGMQVCEKKCQDQVEAAGKAQLQGSETGVSVTSCIPF